MNPLNEDTTADKITRFVVGAVAGMALGLAYGLYSFFRRRHWSVIEMVAVMVIGAVVGGAMALYRGGRRSA